MGGRDEGRGTGVRRAVLRGEGRRGTAGRGEDDRLGQVLPLLRDRGRGPLLGGDGEAVSPVPRLRRRPLAEAVRPLRLPAGSLPTRPDALPRVDLSDDHRTGSVGDVRPDVGPEPGWVAEADELLP